MDFLAILKTLVISVGIPALVHYAGRYVNNDRRKFKVGFAADVVTGAIEVLKIQKGVSSATALVFTEIIAAARAALIEQGFDPSKAEGIAAREAAKFVSYDRTITR